LTLEPTLVAGLELHDVEVTVAHRGGDQLVASALVAIRGAGENFVLVVRLTLRLARADVENGGGGHLVGGETTLGASLTRVGLHAEQVAELFQKRLRLAVSVDGVLRRLFDDDGDVGHLIKVILKIAIRVRERAFLGRVVLGRQQKRVPIPGVRHETGRVGDATEDVGGITVRGDGGFGARERGDALCAREYIYSRQSPDVVGIIVDRAFINHIHHHDARVGLVIAGWETDVEDVDDDDDARR